MVFIYRQVQVRRYLVNTTSDSKGFCHTYLRPARLWDIHPSSCRTLLSAVFHCSPHRAIGHILQVCRLVDEVIVLATTLAN